MRHLFLFLAIIVSPIFRAQTHYTGYSSDNSNGYTGAYHQPAALVNSVHKFSITTGLHSSNTSNYRGTNASLYSMGAGNETEKYKDHKSPGYQAISAGYDIIGIQFELNHRNAFGYGWRSRAVGNINGLPNGLTFASHDSYSPESTVVGVDHPFNNYLKSKFLFNEHRFSYARVIINESNRMLKAGLTFKILNGIDASYFYAQEGAAQFAFEGSALVTSSTTAFEFAKAEKSNFFSTRKNGVGFDLGAVYEIYPDNKKDEYYDMDGVKNIERFDRAKYKYKFGASITDIGRVKFGVDTSTFNFNSSTLPISAETFTVFQLNDLISLFPQNSGFDNLAQTGTKEAEQPTDFNMGLPTALHLNADYHIAREFYVNYNSTLPIYLRKDPSKVHFRSIHSITPRYESDRFGLMLPISIQRNATVNLGIAGRITLKKYPIQIFTGFKNINQFLGARVKYTNGFFLGAAFVKRYTVPKDSDGDKISDDKDECPFDPGLEELNGCPDTDGDGIPDKIDYCIYAAGDKKHNGCPDTDGDGVIDLEDQCPEEAGLAIHYGCPDRDKDGIIDVADRCPDVPGIEMNNGCPFENPGCCMDNDGDGVSNNVDECPDVAGSVYNNGCPIDSTNINKIDFENKRKVIDPNHTSEKVEIIEENRPKEVSPEGELLKESLNTDNAIGNLNVYFDVDDATINPVFESDIREFVERFKLTDSRIDLVVLGHTDNDGASSYNLILSKKRAEVVRRKLIDLGVSEDVVTVYYLGETKPLRDNKSREGKQFNRRVEIILMPKR